MHKTCIYRLHSRSQNTIGFTGLLPWSLACLLTLSPSLASLAPPPVKNSYTPGYPYHSACTYSSAPPKKHNTPNNPQPSTLYAERKPDLETWHRRLGHCNHLTIIDMARQGVVECMPIDLSSAPATCDHCILGKRDHMCQKCVKGSGYQTVGACLCGLVWTNVLCF